MAALHWAGICAPFILLLFHSQHTAFMSWFREKEDMLLLLGRFGHVSLCATLWTAVCQAPLSTGFSRQEYWSGCHALLQEFFPAQGSNPGLLHFRQDCFTTEPPGKLEVGHILYLYWSESCSVMPDCLRHMDCVRGILQARILGWVAVPFSRESSQPRDWTQVSCIADRFFTSWAMREYRYWDFLEIVCDCSFPLAWPKWSYLATVGCKEGWIR